MIFSTEASPFIKVVILAHPFAMASVKRAAAKSSAPTDGDIQPNNPLQSDFNAEDNSSVDSDERYLVRLSES